MNRLIGSAAWLLTLLLVACTQVTATPNPTSPPAPSVTLAMTATATPSATLTDTPASTLTPTATATPTPTDIPTATPTLTPAATLTATSTATLPPAATGTPTPLWLPRSWAETIAPDGSVYGQYSYPDRIITVRQWPQLWQTAARVNLREGPGTGHTVLRVLDVGEYVGVRSAGQWLTALTLDGLEGYLYNTYASRITCERFIVALRADSGGVAVDALDVGYHATALLADGAGLLELRDPQFLSLALVVREGEVDTMGWPVSVPINCERPFSTVEWGSH